MKYAILSLVCLAGASGCNVGTTKADLSGTGPVLQGAPSSQPTFVLTAEKFTGTYPGPYTWAGLKSATTGGELPGPASIMDGGTADEGQILSSGSALAFDLKNGRFLGTDDMTATGVKFTRNGPDGQPIETFEAATLSSVKSTVIEANAPIVATLAEYGKKLSEDDKAKFVEAVKATGAFAESAIAALKTALGVP